jgi:hypothetical protein
MNYRFKKGSAREHFLNFKNFRPVASAINTYFAGDNPITNWFRYSFVRTSPEDRTEFVDLVEPFGKGKMYRKVLEASEEFFRFGRERVRENRGMFGDGLACLVFMGYGIEGVVSEEIIAPIIASAGLTIFASLIPERKPLPDGMSLDWLNDYVGFHAEATRRSRRADKELVYEMPHLRKAVLD